MKYFEVYMYDTSNVSTTKVCSDGEPIADTEELHGYYFIQYEVVEFGEDGIIEDTKHYYGKDPEELLEQIKADHPAEDWQNNDW